MNKETIEKAAKVLHLKRRSKKAFIISNYYDSTRID